jgi:hypothetical protein
MSWDILVILAIVVGVVLLVAVLWRWGGPHSEEPRE